jgi:hypothetical protein
VKTAGHWAITAYSLPFYGILNLVYKHYVLLRGPEFPSQGSEKHYSSAENRQGFRQKLWNKHTKILKYSNIVKISNYPSKDKKKILNFFPQHTLQVLHKLNC